MSTGVTVKIKSKGVDRALRALGGFAEQGKEGAAIGLNDLFRRHFADLHNARHRSGGTGFYQKASDSVFHRVSKEGIYVGSEQLGLRQRLHGGTIRPKRSKFLTIPIHPDAIGKRARDSSLDLNVIRTGKPGVLLLAQTGEGGFFVPYYLLVTSVRQDPDPTVIPEAAQIWQTVQQSLKDTLTVIKRRN